MKPPPIPWPRSDAVARARSFAVILSPLLQPSEDDPEAGLPIFESTPALGSFDAVLAATAIREDAVLVSPDGGFGAVPGLRYPPTRPHGSPRRAGRSYSWPTVGGGRPDVPGPSGAHAGDCQE